MHSLQSLILGEFPNKVLHSFGSHASFTENCGKALKKFFLKNLILQKFRQINYENIMEITYLTNITEITKILKIIKSFILLEMTNVTEEYVNLLVFIYVVYIDNGLKMEK